MHRLAMTLQYPATGRRCNHMSKNFRSRRRRIDKCSHMSEIRIEIAGMSRSVCEQCGRVSVGYIDNHLRRTRLRQPTREAVAS